MTKPIFSHTIFLYFLLFSISNYSVSSFTNCQFIFVLQACSCTLITKDCTSIILPEISKFIEITMIQQQLTLYYHNRRLDSEPVPLGMGRLPTKGTKLIVRVIIYATKDMAYRFILLSAEIKKSSLNNNFKKSTWYCSMSADISIVEQLGLKR